MIETLENIKLVITILGLLAFPLIFIGVVVFILRGFIFGIKRRGEDFRRFAQEDELSYSGSHLLSEVAGAPYFRLFNLGNGHGRKIENSVDGAVDGFQISIFDYTYYNTFGFQKMPKQTVVLINSPHLNLPLFSVQPKGKNPLRNLTNKLYAEINFSDKTFADNYLLISQDPHRIKNLFNEQTVSHFKAIGNFIVEGAGNQLLFYRDGIIASPEQFRWMLQEGVKIARILAR